MPQNKRESLIYTVLKMNFPSRKAAMYTIFMTGLLR